MDAKGRRGGAAINATRRRAKIPRALRTSEDYFHDRVDPVDTIAMWSFELYRISFSSHQPPKSPNVIRYFGLPSCNEAPKPVVLTKT